MNNCFIENPRTHPVFIQTKFKKKTEKKLCSVCYCICEKSQHRQNKEKSGLSTWYLDHVAMARIFLA